MDLVVKYPSVDTNSNLIDNSYTNSTDYFDKAANSLNNGSATFFHEPPRTVCRIMPDISQNCLSKDSIGLKQDAQNCLPPNGPNRSYLCKTCGCEFSRLRSLTIHRRKHKPHTPSQSLSALAAHEGLHKGQMPKFCRYCGKAFSTKGPVTKNTPSHEKFPVSLTKSFPCNLCNSSFRQKRFLRSHQFQTHRSKNNVDCTSQDDPIFVNTSLPCSFKPGLTEMNIPKDNSLNMSVLPESVNKIHGITEQLSEVPQSKMSVASSNLAQYEPVIINDSKTNSKPSIPANLVVVSTSSVQAALNSAASFKDTHSPSSNIDSPPQTVMTSNAVAPSSTEHFRSISDVLRSINSQAKLQQQQVLSPILQQNLLSTQQSLLSTQQSLLSATIQHNVMPSGPILPLPTNILPCLPPTFRMPLLAQHPHFVAPISAATCSESSTVNTAPSSNNRNLNGQAAKPTVVLSPNVIFVPAASAAETASTATNNRKTYAEKVCSNCATTVTSMWRRDAGKLLCNACKLYKNLHGLNRPMTLRKDTIYRRTSTNRRLVYGVTDLDNPYDTAAMSNNNDYDNPNLNNFTSESSMAGCNSPSLKVDYDSPSANLSEIEENSPVDLSVKRD